MNKKIIDSNEILLAVIDGKNIYTKRDLYKVTLVNLNKYCTEKNIKRFGKRDKESIVTTLYSELLMRINISDRSSSAGAGAPKFPVAPTNFIVRVDDQERYDVRPWFQTNYSKFSRFKEAPFLKNLIKFHCWKYKLTRSQVISTEKNGLFLPIEIAIYVAFTLDYEYAHIILSYFVHERPNALLLKYKKQVDFLTKSLQKNGVLAKQHPWSTFNYNHAYYWFSIGDIVKAGAVGIGADTKQNLDGRLSNHRVTCAKLKLLGIIRFENPGGVSSFESWIKHLLKPYALGNPDKRDLNLEQYPVCNQKQVFKIILKQCEDLPDTVGSLVPERFIADYNRSAAMRLETEIK